MGKGEKTGKSGGRRFQSESEEEQQQNRKTPSQIEVQKVGSDDDDDETEANEDLSLKIVEKAMLRRSYEGSKINAGSFVVLEDDELVTNFAADDRSRKKESKKKKRKKIEAELEPVPSEKDGKFESFCSDLFQVDAPKKERNVESEKTMEVVDEAVKTNPVEVSDNPVLRKLLRGPRYFDPESSWGTCYNCGEEGHMAFNCTSGKRKKPCFVCGSLEHEAKQCPKGKDCYNCKKRGHRAKDCPENSRKGARNSNICLICGDSSHNMFSCGNDYFADDLKEIVCYVCGNTGHLCCVNYTDIGPREITCYRCGLSGHTGLVCTYSQKKKASKVSVGSCYRCGEEGHFARECTNPSEGGERNSGLHTPKRIISRSYSDHIGAESAPLNGKTRRKRKTQSERGFSSISKLNVKYGWSTEDPGDLTSNESKASRWRSPATPNNKRFRMPDYSASDHSSTSYTPGEFHSLHYNSSAPKGSVTFNQPRYASRNSDYSASYGSGTHRNNFSSWTSGNSSLYGSAGLHQIRFESRFNDNSNLGMRRNYDW